MKQIVRRLTRLLLPGIFSDWYQRHKEGRTWGYTWRGVYTHWREVPKHGEGFVDGTWLSKHRKLTRTLLKEYQDSHFIPHHLQGHRSLLPLTVSLIGQFVRGHSLTILDFGGGMGVDFVQLISGSVRCENVQYHVVDTGKSCKIGLSLFEGEERIHFHSELPSLSEVDLVFLNSALEYIPEWAELLSTLASYHPKYFLMVRLDAGEIPTHARGQRSIKGSTIPYWCLNIHTVVKTMSELRYSLLFKSSGPGTYDEDNLPQNYRLGHYCNLLFCQTDDPMPNRSSGSSS